MLTHYMHVHFSFLFYTLIGSLSDDPEFACLDWMFYFIDQVLMSSFASWRAWSYPWLDHWNSCFLLFCWFLINLSYHPIPFLCSLLSCVDIICILAVILIYHSDYIAFSGYFRLSVYTYGILLAYMYRRLSSRLCFHVLWEAEHDRVSLVSEPAFYLRFFSFHKNDLVLTCNLKHAILTLHYTYTIHIMILTPLENLIVLPLDIHFFDLF